MAKQSIKVVVILIMIFSFISLCNTEPFFNHSLTEHEMAIPKSGYQPYTLYNDIMFVGYNAPIKKPFVLWYKNLMGIPPLDFVVDSKGSTWYEDKSSSTICRNAITCWDSDGNENCVPIYNDHGSVHPVMILEGAVIFLKKLLYSDKCIIVCYALNGDYVWESEPFECSSIINRALRISNNRILIPSGKINSGGFVIHSLENGNLLERIKFPDWNDYDKRQLPLELSDNGWIGFQTDYIVKFNNDLTVEWKHKINKPLYTNEYTLSRNGILLLGLDYSLKAIDINNGKVIWEKPNLVFSSSLYRAKTDSFFVFSNCELFELDSNGQELNTIFTDTYLDNSNMIIFNDNKILFSNGNSMKLVDFNNDLVWELDKSELGIHAKLELTKGIIQPAPNGRIIFSFFNREFKKKPIRLFSLGQVNANNS